MTAHAANGVETELVDVQGLGVDQFFADMGHQYLAENDFPRLADGQAHHSPALQGDRRFDIQVRLPDAVRNDLQVLSRLPIALPDFDNCTNGNPLGCLLSDPERLTDNLRKWQATQDQVLAAYGGFNYIEFGGNEDQAIAGLLHDVVAERGASWHETDQVERACIQPGADGSGRWRQPRSEGGRP